MYDDEEPGPTGRYESYVAEGDFFRKNGEYGRAVSTYTTALELKPGERDCLVVRSLCHLLLGDATKALKDAEDALKEDPFYHRALYRKAEALYSTGEFEMALVFYHRGRRVRPQMQRFKLGIQKSQEAIDNSVGSPEKVTLTREGDLSYFEAQTQPKRTPKPKPKGLGQIRKEVVKKQPRKLPPPSTLKPRTMRELLGEMYGDRVYLEQLLKNTETKTESDLQIQDLVCDGIEYLEGRTSFWQQQKPMYARRRVKIKQGKEKCRDLDKVKEDIITAFKEVDEAQEDGNYKAAVKTAKKCLDFVDQYSAQELHDKVEIIATLNSCLGSAHLELSQLDQALKHHQLDLQHSTKLRHAAGRSRALENLGRVYAVRGEFKKAIDVYQQRLESVDNDVDKAWLYHELGRCHLERGETEYTLDMADKSLEAATLADDDTWKMNAQILLGQTNVKIGELRSGLKHFETALILSRIVHDTVVTNAIKTTLEEIHKQLGDEWTGMQTEDSTESVSGSQEDQSEDQTEDQNEDQTEDQREDQTEDQTEDQRDDQTEDQREDQREDQTEDQTGDQNEDQTEDQREDQETAPEDPTETDPATSDQAPSDGSGDE